MSDIEREPAWWRPVATIPGGAGEDDTSDTEREPDWEPADEDEADWVRSNYR